MYTSIPKTIIVFVFYNTIALFVSFVLLGRFVCVKRNLTSFSYNEAPVLLKKQTRSSQSSKKTTKSLDIREGWGETGKSDGTSEHFKGCWWNI